MLTAPANASQPIHMMTKLERSGVVEALSVRRQHGHQSGPSKQPPVSRWTPGLPIWPMNPIASTEDSLKGQAALSPRRRLVEQGGREGDGDAA